MVVDSKKRQVDPYTILAVTILVLFSVLLFVDDDGTITGGVVAGPFAATVCSTSPSVWNPGCDQAYTDNNVWAKGSSSTNVVFRTFSGISTLPVNALVSKVKVRCEQYTTSTKKATTVQVSRNGGVTWSSAYSVTKTSNPSGVLQDLDVTGTTPWTLSDLSDANFRIRVNCNTPSGHYCYFDVVAPIIEYSVSCTPTTSCAAQGKNCGTINDGCQTVSCGTCTSPQTCGGGGTANVCGCTPTTCAALGANCGNPSDGCGGALPSCGTCNSGNTCSASNQCVAFCSDGIDNDGDSLTDFPNDLGCSSALDTDETDVPAPITEMKGVAFPCWYTSCYEDASVSQTLDTIKNNGANWIEIVPTWYMLAQGSSSVVRTSRTASDAGVKNVIRLVHQRGMNVFLKAHVDVEDNSWRGNFCPDNPDAWWLSYQDFIQSNIGICNDPDPEIECELFSIGTELVRVAHDWPVSDSRYCNPGSQSWSSRWAELAQTVHAALPATTKEIYCANHDEPFVTTNLDYVGIDMYSIADTTGPDANNNCAPTITQMKNTIRIKVNEQVLSASNRDIIWCEQGFTDTDCTATQPWVRPVGQEIDFQEQADAYQALQSVLKEPGSDKIVGSFGWMQDPRGTQTPAVADNGFIYVSAAGTEPAWDVLGNYWKNTCEDTICQASELCSTCTADCGSCASPPPPPSPSQTYTLNPIADTYVRSGTYASQNFGTAITLQIDGDLVTSNNIKFALLKFDLSSVSGTITSARLRLFVPNSANADSSSTQTIRAVADTSWGETTVNYNTRPTLGATPLTSIPGGALNSWIEVNLPLSAIPVGQLLSLAIDADSTQTNGLDINSREATTNQPQLIITTGTPTLKSTPANFKVAFIADTGKETNFQNVLNLIKTEGADMVLHMGDLGYGSNTSLTAPAEWEQNIIGTLDNGYNSNGCTKFPYFISMGNHENGDRLYQWTQTQAANSNKGYREILRDRLNCHGIMPDNDGNPNNDGTKSSFTYNNLQVVFTAPDETCTNDCGGTNSEKSTFLNNELAGSDSLWKIAAWHKLRSQVQTGSYDGSSTMDSFYENSRIHGAVIATGHWHTYSRTHVVNSFLNPIPVPVDTVSPLEIKQGQTIAFHSGLGGNSIREQLRCLPATAPYGCNGEWASIYSNNQSATYGALFIEFNVDGNPRKANGYFKNTNNIIIDSFTLENTAPGTVI